VNGSPSVRSTIGSTLNNDNTDSFELPTFTASYAKLLDDAIYEHAPTYPQKRTKMHTPDVFTDSSREYKWV
jgi:hypothetical protein